MRKYFLWFVMCLCVQGVRANHFLQDDKYRQEVTNAFHAKMDLVGRQFFDLKDDSVTEQETEALQFLYAYMPLADITDYPTQYFLDQVRTTFQTRREMPWGDRVPELLFRHFVLPLRVNNENLDDARKVFYKALKARVEGMGMKEAILEVNHWCHEHVTYNPSDGRTLSPMACMKNALGRCGEESTFTVAALRAIGIPARQVYTPRWAHTDDNHAWVEAWADGQWYFLGACEPEPVLNLGWFNAPASRSMLMHTRVFGHYNGPEEVVLRTSNFTEINLIDKYAQTSRVDFTVVDENQQPVNGAQVEFKIYNYAEFFTAVTKYTDEQGHTFLSAGKGDLLVWASKEGHYGFTKASFGKDRQVTICLNRTRQRDVEKISWTTDSLDIVPPEENAILPEVTEAENRQNKIRLSQEDSIRKAYERTFYQATDNSDIAKLLTKARGNWTTIKAFHEKYRHHNEARVMALLNTLTDKDLRDMPMAILEDHYLAKSNQLCPRVENEMITAPFKQYLEQVFDDETADSFRRNPAQLVAWVKNNIRINPDKGAMRIAQTPVGCGGRS